MDNNLTFGQWLKRRRRGLGLTQRSLGQQAGYASETIRKVEAEELRPSRQMAERMADALEIDPADRALFIRFARDGLDASEPLPPTQSVHVQSSQAETSALAPRRPEARRHNLRASLTSFIGREPEIAAIQHWLSERRLVTVSGPGGMGKSRLALEAATTLVADFTDGVWLVELAALSDPLLVPRAVAQVLGMTTAADAPILDRLTDHVRDLSLLLVLDNCEHLLDACARLAEHLLQAAPRLRLLATSREGLGLAGESTYRVPALTLPDERHPLALDSLARSEAIRLFTERAQTTQPAFAVTKANAPAVAQICHRLDGIPLAIELAAARTRSLAPEQIAARLDDRFRLLTGGSRTALPRHQTLRATMDWSHDVLPTGEQTLFRRLGVFAGGWTLEAAEQICAEAVPQGDTFSLLDELVNKSLVAAEPRERAARYHMLETMRHYGQEKMQAAGEAAMIRTRHLEFYLSLAERAETCLRRPEQLEWLARLDAEHDNLRAALAWALEAEQPALPEAALRLTAYLTRYWISRGHQSEGLAWVARALAQGEPRPSALRARALYYYAGLTLMASGTVYSIPIHQQALAMAEAVGDTATEAHALMMLGNVAETQGDEAAPQHSRALALFEALGDTWGQANTYNHMSQTQMRRGNAARAEALMRQALDLHRQTGDRSSICHALNYLAAIAKERGELDQAKDFLEEAFPLARESGHFESLTHGLIILAEIAFQQSDYAQAQQLFEDCQTSTTRGGYKGWATEMHAARGLVACCQGDYARALSLQAEALSGMRETKAPTLIMRGQLQLGWIHLQQGELRQAGELIEPAVTYFRDMAARPRLAEALCSLGRVSHQQGNQQRAAELLDEALAISRGIGDAWMTAISLQSLGRLALALGDSPRAGEHFHESLVLGQRMGARREIAASLEALATVALEAQHAARAARLLGAAEALRAVIGAPVPVVERAAHEATLEHTREALGSERFEAARLDGQAMEWPAAVAYAIAS